MALSRRLARGPGRGDLQPQQHSPSDSNTQGGIRKATGWGLLVCSVPETISLGPLRVVSLGTHFAGCSQRVGRDGTKSRAGRRAGRGPSRQQDEPRAAGVSHRELGGETARAKFKILALLVRLLYYFPGEMHQIEMMAVTQKRIFLSLECNY